MKLTAVLLLIVAGMFAQGCATPAYSAHERHQMIARNWQFEYKQMADDWDSLLMLRPSSRMSIWHIR